MHVLTRRLWQRGVGPVMVLLAAVLLPVASVSPANASYGISQDQGIDTCSAPSVDQMRAYWASPYGNIGIYIGGALRACAQPNLTSSWLQQVGPTGIGWHFLPIWVGPQAACTSFSARISYDPATAYQQGRTEARSAYNATVNLGMDTANAPITYDLEYFNTSDAGCVASARQFVQGWVDEMHVPAPQLAGIYTNSCILPNFASLTTPPDFIWAAEWDGKPSTWALSCVSSGSWYYNQRHKQYAGGHNETWNGVTLNQLISARNGA
jgi:hypothetical protein